VPDLKLIWSNMGATCHMTLGQLGSFVKGSFRVAVGGLIIVTYGRMIGHR